MPNTRRPSRVNDESRQRLHVKPDPTQLVIEDGRTSDGRLAVSVEEAMHALSIGRSTAYAMVQSGQLPSVQLGRRRLVPVRALEALLAVEVA